MGILLYATRYFLKIENLITCENVPNDRLYIS